MKILVLGGYGVFGGRLVRLLLKDGHSVWIAGRSFQKAQRFTEQHQGVPLQLDRSGDLSPLLTVRPDVVVDASGPFHAYGDGALRVPVFCLQNGLNYLDLSDDAGFTARISELDAKAKAAGCFALSGASSMPAISAAVVTALSADLDTIHVIETAIVPGNRAPRGRSVIAALLSQVGAPLRVWRGGRWRDTWCWCDPRTYALGNGRRRQARLIGVPDLQLFPRCFSSRSVISRAGTELRVMNLSLSALAHLRQLGLFWSNAILEEVAYRLSEMIRPIGSDKGAMVVEVTGSANGKTVIRRWELIAESGDGPFIPAIPVRTLLRQPRRIAPGARPCLCEARLADIEDAMSDLAVATDSSETPAEPLFEAALRDRWCHLPGAVRQLHTVHDIESFSGVAKVERGTSLVARVAGWFFGFPNGGESVPLTITKTRTSKGEIWERDFGGRAFRSYLSPSSRPYHYKERFGAFTYEQELPVADGALHFPVRRGWFLGIPLPSFLLPGSDSLEFEIDGRFHFDVALQAPLGGGLIVRYSGSVMPDGSDAH